MKNVQLASFCKIPESRQLQLSLFRKSIYTCAFCGMTPDQTIKPPNLMHIKEYETLRAILYFWGLQRPSWFGCAKMNLKSALKFQSLSCPLVF